MTPRKHAKFIHTWADGEDIQYFDDYVNEWILIGDSHVWSDDNEYRFRPKMIKCGAPPAAKYNPAPVYTANCIQHPAAPHSVDVEASFRAGHTVCACQSWAPGDAS